MKLIEYKIVFTEGADCYVEVRARSINSGFRKAMNWILSAVGTDDKRGKRGQHDEIARIEFSQVKS